MPGAGETAVEQTDVGSYFVANYPPFSVWKPMESLYPADKKRLMTWTEGVTPDNAQHKTNELVLPDGRRP